jgi:hypothetical protein
MAPLKRSIAYEELAPKTGDKSPTTNGPPPKAINRLLQTGWLGDKLFVYSRHPLYSLTGDSSIRLSARHPLYSH